MSRESPASSVYVYGVVRPGSPGVAGDGVGSVPAPVRTIEGHGAAAVVSDVPASWRAAGRVDIEVHDRVLAELIGRTTVVPMRFGTVMATDDEIRKLLLERHERELSSLLEQLDGRVQMSVKAYYVEEAPLRQVLARRPELKRRSDEIEALPVAVSQPRRIALGRDVAAALEEQRALDERTLLGPLAELADDVRVESPVSERQAVSVQLLVDARRRAQLDQAVQRLAAEHGERVALRYVGPLPPYSFSDLSLEPWD